MFENSECILCQPSCQHLLVNTLRVDEFHRRQVVCEQLTTVVRVHQVLGEGLKRVGCEEGVVSLTGQKEAAHEVVELQLVDLPLRALGDDAARTDVIQVVEHLGGVALHFVGVDDAQGLDTLVLQAYIIIIGGVDNGIFTLCIAQPALLTWGEEVTLLVDTTQGLIGKLTVLMELAVTGSALAEAHLLHMGHHALHLVVARLKHLVQPLISLIILHPGDTDKGLIITSLRPTLAITVAQVISPGTVIQRRVEVAVMIIIGEGIQLVDIVPIRTRTG